MCDKKIKVAIIGANGKMGQLANSVISSMPNFLVVALVNRQDNLDDVLKATGPDIAIELTAYDSVFANARTIIANGVYPVIGASGLKPAEVEILSALCIKNKIGGIIAPNFSVGMALISKFARELKQYYHEFSIIEFHHAQKKDKPSGTARYIAEILGTQEEDICSIRSDGFVAKQQIYVSAAGERILIEQESFDRTSFSQGIALCVNKVMDLDHLVVGLENIL